MDPIIIALIGVILFILIIILAIVLIPYIGLLYRVVFKKSRYSKLGSSSKIRLIHQVKEAVIQLSKDKTGAIITIENHDQIDNLRTDGVIIDANISSSLIIALFQKNSPLHDGAIVIRDNKILFAATYYKITRKSIDNRYGARHRAAMGISELSDATTIVVSEETGGINITKNGLFHKTNIDNFQESLVKLLRE
ncbi:uncharacterized protein (TIGR00159 family) [Mycoplasma testudineum]|uniref:Uncharacterized protein (TIGR00159 family) n=1 Tax=Mycoplasma testudineum TaxID=244584 RepID=A0A4R6IGI5_9MOLU|nr:diadenylate cyclase [Mycoplasma testudineum]OYD27061.1 hypothetical protein CG473_00200 [Mycoplasma testudineum]TDO21184.1 uncharacterized protein (TIGR00159 family) [Mycoplasma testudineum]